MRPHDAHLQKQAKKEPCSRICARHLATAFARLVRYDEGITISMACKNQGKAVKPLKFWKHKQSDLQRIAFPSVRKSVRTASSTLAASMIWLSVMHSLGGVVWADLVHTTAPLAEQAVNTFHSSYYTGSSYWGSDHTSIHSSKFDAICRGDGIPIISARTVHGMGRC